MESRTNNSNNRSSSYKKGIDSDAGRRRRDDTRIMLRKNKREEGIQKRRAMGASNAVPSTGETEVFQMSHNGTSTIAPNTRTYTVADIPTLFVTLQNHASSSSEDVLDAVRGFRKMLSVEQNPPVKDIIECGALPHFVTLLTRNDVTPDEITFKIHFEATWALTNVASTEFTRAVVECNAVPQLIKLLLSGSPDVREQSAWCLGNIAGDSPELRDIILQSGGMAPLLQNVANPSSDSLLSNVVWALSNFCRGKPQPQLVYVAPALPCISNLLVSGKPTGMQDLLWALSYISDGDDARIQEVMNTGVTPHLVRSLAHESTSIITPALRTLGNFVSGSDTQTQAVVDAGVLEYVVDLLANPKKNVRKETCWLLSNIAAGTHAQITSIMRSPRPLSLVIDAVKNAEWDVKKEAAWVVSNIATGGIDDHVMGLVELNAIDALCSVLTAGDSKIVMIVLDAIEKILDVGQKVGKDYAHLVDECDGLDHIESLQESSNDEVYQKSISIIERFFGVEEEGDENLIPGVSNDGQFVFGVPSTKAGASTEQQQVQQPLQPFNF